MGRFKTNLTNSNLNFIPIPMPEPGREQWGSILMYESNFRQIFHAPIGYFTSGRKYCAIGNLWKVNRSWASAKKDRTVSFVPRPGQRQLELAYCPFQVAIGTPPRGVHRLPPCSGCDFSPFF